MVESLPPLPEMVDTYETDHYPRGYTAEQMRAYALRAIAQERGLLRELLAHEFAEDCQECAIGKSQAWARAKARISADTPSRSPSTG